MLVKKICVIIPVYNDWDFILRNITVFDHMISEYGSLFDLYFVDNGSDHIPMLDDKKYNIFFCKKPGSYSARNFALKKLLSKYEYFVFTDADCSPEKDWISNINKYVNQNDIDLFAGDINIFAASEKPNLIEAFDLVLGLPQERYVKRGYAVTANLTVSKKVFLEVGLFDESRFSGGDADLCKRAVCLGFNLDFKRDVVVNHPARKSFKEIIKKTRRVSGGQTGNGTLKSRLKYLSFNSIPPVRAFWFIFCSRHHSILVKLKASFVVTILWPIRLIESWRAFVSGPVVR